MKMRINKHSICLLTAGIVSVVALVACSEEGKLPKKTLTTPETVMGDIRKDNYKENPTPENERKMDHALMELDSEIRELDELVQKNTGSEKVRAQEKLEQLKQKRGELAREYNKAKYDAAVSEAKQAIKDFGESLKQAITPTPSTNSY